MKVGVVLVIADNRDTGERRTYAGTRDMAQQAELLGFDSVWLYDHFLYREEDGAIQGIWECWTFLSALADATERVELGTLVSCTQFRNPAIFAKMAATLDEVSQGRLILGLGAGWNRPEFEAFGVPFDHRVDRFEEAIQIIKPLLHGETVTFHGTYYHVTDCVIVLPDPRQDGPLLMVGTLGKRMMRLTARYADVWNAGYFGPAATFEEPLRRMRAACAAEGRDPSTLETTVMLSVGFPDLGAPPGMIEDYLSGPDEITQALHDYEALGVGHVMIHFGPFNQIALEQLAEALAAYRAG